MKQVVFLVLLSFSLTGCGKGPETKNKEFGVKNIPDFGSIEDTKAKKAAFFDYFYPIIVEENRRILVEREIVKNHKPKSKKLAGICEKYSKDCVPFTEEKRQELLEKVNVIPPSMILAQAANESAWGTSRFAKKAYNYFGQWCFKKGCGLVPEKRQNGEKHEVRKFKSPQASVRAYLVNVNTGIVYEELRKIRNSKKGFTGYELAQGLIKYSQRREAYVKEIRSMISFNKLVEKYDTPFWEALSK